MNTELIQLADQTIKKDEGRVPVPYQDSKKIWTMGYGRNIEANPLSEDEMQLMLANDRNRAIEAVIAHCVGFESLSLVRQAALINFAFNVGEGTFRLFKKFLGFMYQGNYKKAADELRSSLYYKQVGARGERIASMIETDTLPKYYQ